MQRQNTVNIVSWVMTSFGALVIIISIKYGLTILALVGLGLVFWGMVLQYIKTEEYARKSLLNASTVTSFETIGEILEQLDYKGTPLYLSPEYLKDISSNEVFIPKRKNSELPKPNQILWENQIFIQDPQGMLLKPPGTELTRLFEKTLNTSFTKVDLKYLEKNIHSLIVDELEIAEDAKIEIYDNQVHVRLENSVYKDICNENLRSEVLRSLGCPICSAIACAFAKASGKPVTIERIEITGDGKTTETHYKIRSS